MDFGKLFSFDGRVGRGAYWGVGILSSIIGGVAWAVVMSGTNAFVMLVALVVAIAAAVIGLATTVKRWHDRDKSGFWYFIVLIPIIGGIWALVEQGFLAGTPGDNRYGSPDSGSPFADEALPGRATV